MKNINKFITEAIKGWAFYNDPVDTSGQSLDALNNKEAKWLFINTEGEEIIPVTEKDLKSWEDDLGQSYILPACKKLKIGESFDADGGISIYVRIKK